MDKRILVLGGTGTLGTPVARSLFEAGFGVRIMSRDLQKARRLFGKTMELFEGNPTDPDCLQEAVAGCSGVHISLPPGAEQQAAELAARLAPKPGVERISYISGATVAGQNRWFPMVDEKFLAEQAICGSGIPYTIFCPTWIMEVLPKFVNQGRAAIFGKQPCPYHWVAAADLARMVTNAYRLPEAENKRLWVHGPEAIPMQEALQRYCAVFQPGIKQVSSMPFWLVRLLATFTRNAELKSAGEMMAYFEKVGEMGDPSEANCLLGRPAITLDQWLSTPTT